MINKPTDSRVTTEQLAPPRPCGPPLSDSSSDSETDLSDGESESEEEATRGEHHSNAGGFRLSYDVMKAVSDHLSEQICGQQVRPTTESMIAEVVNKGILDDARARVVLHHLLRSHMLPARPEVAVDPY